MLFKEVDEGERKELGVALGFGPSNRSGTDCSGEDEELKELPGVSRGLVELVVPGRPLDR